MKRPRGRIEGELDSLAKLKGDNNELLFFFAGYGPGIDKTMIIYPYDIKFENKKYIDEGMLLDRFSNLPSGSFIEIILDVGLSKPKVSLESLASRYLELTTNLQTISPEHSEKSLRHHGRFRQEVNHVIWIACQHDQTAYERDTDGLFTYYFCNTLSG
jgi:hypothetical protein